MIKESLGRNKRKEIGQLSDAEERKGHYTGKGSGGGTTKGQRSSRTIISARRV